MNKNFKKCDVIDLSMTEDVKAKDRAIRISNLPYIVGMTLLPDLHIKEGMEAPSSMITAMQGVIVPHLASAAINDGMGFIITDINTDAVSVEQLYEIAKLINKEAAKTKFSMTKYSWSAQQLHKAMLYGAEPMLNDYGLNKLYLNAVENHGKGSVNNITEQDLVDFIPGFLRKSKFSRCEIGLNFGGNHFLEIQSVDKIIEPNLAEKWDIKPGKLGIMYHHGPGPLGGNLLNLYTYRKKPSLHRKAGYAIFRFLYQAMKGKEQLKTFGGFNPWLVLKEGSRPARAFEVITGIVDNYGYAYRMATVRAITDALEKVFKTNSSQLGLRLVTDISHNMLQAENHDGKNFWVSRHNCCRPRKNVPGILAGSERSCSCIVLGHKECEKRICGYDHGIGELQKRAEAAGVIKEDIRKLHSIKLTMLPGTDRIVKKEDFTLYDTSLSDKVLNKLSEAGIVSGLAYTRPLLTLKMVR